VDKITKPTVVDTEKQAQWGRVTGRNYIRPTQTHRAHIALNCYEPGANDEMHCHPGSDHTFLVIEGECTMKGLHESEEYKLPSTRLCMCRQDIFTSSTTPVPAG
jgi:quercetin dioxygenase-like cupin family protein